MFDRVAPDGAGHPLLLALACSEAAGPRRPAGLPFEAPTRERLEADLRRVRARLNQRGPARRCPVAGLPAHRRLVGPD